MEDASKPPLRPPEYVCLRPQDEPFWAAIIDARARTDWPEADLVVASQLARLHADIESESQALATEGNVEMIKGVRVVNPRVAMIGALQVRMMSYVRLLRMGGYTVGQEADDVATRRKLERTAEEIAGRVKDEAKDNKLFA